MTVKPLASFSKAWKVLPQHIDPVERATNASETQPAGMVRVPAPATRSRATVLIEGGLSRKTANCEAAQVHKYFSSCRFPSRQP